MVNAQNIQLQKLTAQDAALLSEVALKAYCDHYLHLWYDGGEWYKEKSFAPGNLEQELKDENALFFLIKEGSSYTGFLKLNIDAAFGACIKEEALELERIYLDKSSSGKGIGSFLLDYTFELAKSLNKKIVWLKAMDSSEAAIRFYKSHGFEICGTHHLDFPQMKEEYRGMVIMQKML